MRLPVDIITAEKLIGTFAAPGGFYMLCGSPADKVQGNGRSIRELIRCMALHYGFSLDWSRVDLDGILVADVRSVVDDRAFCDVIVECVV